MAEINNVIAEASQDLQTIEDFVNLPADSEVYPRLLPSVNVGTLAGTRDAIFKAGGLPAEPFATKALMTASALVDGDYAQVTDGGADNGLYVKTAGAWVKSAYDPLSQAKDYTDEFISLVTRPKTGKNLYDPSKKVMGSRIITGGVLNSAEGWSISDYIPVEAGKPYTISATARRVGHGFFADKESASISGSDNKSTPTFGMIAPQNAKYLVVNIDSNEITAENVQVEQSGIATEYEPFVSLAEIKKSALPDEVAYKSDLLKPYEKRYVSKNLFDKSQIVPFQQLNSSSGHVYLSPTLVDWSTSSLIPVTAGETYTLSGYRGRGGLSFFASAESIGDALLYVGDATMPLTVTAPEGANFVVFNTQAPGATTFENLQFERGAVATAYTEYDSFLGVGHEYIVGSSPEVGTLESSLTIRPNNNARITATQDIKVDIDLVISRPISLDKSSSLNFTGDMVDGALVRALSDDIAPLRMENTTIGANHGYYKVLCTLSGHGKTNSDIGSVWTDGTNEWVVIDIVSSSQFAITSRVGNLSSLSSGTLTHVSGASNIASVTPTSKASGQWYSVYKNRKISVFADGAKIDINAPRVYEYKDSVAFHESYEIIAKTDIVEWLIANGGVERKEYDAEPSVLYNNSYVFDKDGGCTIYTSLTAYKSIPFADYMGTQSIAFTNANGRYYYVPKTVPFTQDGLGYDFTKLQSMPAPIPSSLFFNEAKNEVGANPVDRLIQFSGDLGYATGYLPVLDAEPEARKLNASNKYLEVRNSSLKIYPRLIDGLKTTLAAGDTFAGVAYRKYFKRDNKRTAKYVVRSQIADFLYLDWHSAKTDVIELDDDLVGREFTVHEKSSNVALLSAFATNNIAVKIDSTKSYGYLVLRFDK